MNHSVEWRSVLGGFGAQCVMTVGIIQMQLLSVENLDLVQKVGHLFVFSIITISNVKCGFISRSRCSELGNSRTRYWTHIFRRSDLHGE